MVVVVCTYNFKTQGGLGRSRVRAQPGFKRLSELHLKPNPKPYKPNTAEDGARCNGLRVHSPMPSRQEKKTNSPKLSLTKGSLAPFLEPCMVWLGLPFPSKQTVL